MRAAKRITGARSGREIFLTDRDLTVTHTNIRKHRGTPDSRTPLNYAIF
jgi:hypothetical protein